jgi:Zn-dependent protease
MEATIQTIAIYALPVLFAITLHEAAHAYAAKYFGDLTAYSQGRMSLNPSRHIDPLGTVVIPLTLALFSSPFIFGYAKPVPVDFSRLRNPKKQMAWVALAGPMANVIMALFWMLSEVLMRMSGVTEVYFYKLANAGVEVNLVLFAFNLFPLPPLDGGRIMISILPNRHAFRLSRIEPYGFFIVLGLAMFGLLKYWMGPVMLLVFLLLKALMSPFESLFI